MKVEKRQNEFSGAADSASSVGAQADFDPAYNPEIGDQRRYDHESKLVWTRDNPDHLAGARRKTPNLEVPKIPKLIEADAGESTDRSSKNIEKPSRKIAPKSEPKKQLEPKPKIDYRRFFWTEPGVESNNSHDSRNILPSATPAQLEAVLPNQPNKTQTETVTSAPESVPAPSLPEYNPTSQTNEQFNQNLPPELPSQEAKTNPSQTQELDSDQLVSLAKTIKVGETNLFNMYETHQVDAQGLHNVAQEYLRGGDVREVLTNEMIQEQLKYEKDPQLKHRSVAAGAKRATTTVAKKAGVVKAKTSKKVNTQTAKHGAKRLSHHSRRAFDFYRGMYEDYPLLFQVMGVVLGVVLYFALLVIIIKA